MRLFIDNGDYFGFLKECISRRPCKAIISSFGIYAGILADGRDTQEWGRQYKSATRELLDRLINVPRVEILVGLDEYKSCKGTIQCIDCERRYALSLIRLVNHAEAFPNFAWRVITRSHIKCALFFYDDRVPRGVIGSRNFTDSDWAEASAELDGNSVIQLERHLRKIWNEARVLTDKTAGEILEEQGISQRAISTILIDHGQTSNGRR